MEALNNTGCHFALPVQNKARDDFARSVDAISLFRARSDFFSFSAFTTDDGLVSEDLESSRFLGLSAGPPLLPPQPKMLSR